MADQKKRKGKTAKIDSGLHSDILNMIRANVNLAARVMPNADVDTYSKGDTPQPVNQYTKGSALGIDLVSNPANLGAIKGSRGRG